MPNLMKFEPPPSADEPPAKGTLFPEFKEGGSPGDAESASDITGLVLKGLSDNDDTETVRGPDGSSLSLVQSPLEGAPAPMGTPVAKVESTVQPEEKKDRRPRTAQERIAQLTKRYRQEQNNNNELSTQVTELLTYLQKQDKEIQALRGQVNNNKPHIQKEQDIFGIRPDGAGPNAVPDPSTGIPVSADTIRSIVTEAITDYDQRQRKVRDEQAQLAALQEQSFVEAMEEVPELADKRSKAFRYFSEVYEVSPLQKLPDGPYQIALQIKGMLADDAAPAPSKPADNVPRQDRIRQAALKPQPTGEIPQSERVAMQKEFAEISKLRKAGNEDFALYRRWRQLRQALATTPQE